MSDEIIGKIILEKNIYVDSDIIDSINGWKWKLCVEDIDEWLRKKYKYDNSLNEDIDEFIEQVRDQIRGILYDRGLVLE